MTQLVTQSDSVGDTKWLSWWHKVTQLVTQSDSVGDTKWLSWDTKWLSWWHKVTQLGHKVTQLVTQSDSVGDTKWLSWWHKVTQLVTRSDSVGDTKWLSWWHKVTQLVTQSDSVGDTKWLSWWHKVTQLVTRSDSVGDTRDALSLASGCCHTKLGGQVFFFFSEKSLLLRILQEKWIFLCTWPANCVRGNHFRAGNEWASHEQIQSFKYLELVLIYFALESKRKSFFLCSEQKSIQCT